MRLSIVPFVLVTACSSFETLTLPEDRAEYGVVVGVKTLQVAEDTVDVWYPATGETPDGEDVVDVRDFVPETFLERLGDDFPIPTFTQRAVRDATPRALEEGLPVVLFSHGFGGFRDQSTELTTHLASRGYVVVATDHIGRTLGDVAPCLLTPPPGTCNFSGFGGDDPAQADLAQLLAWLDSEPEELAGLADTEQVGIFGHSAGGGSTTLFASTETRIDAALPMAGAGAFTRELPSAILGGSCDGIVRESSLITQGPTASEGYLSITGAGHLAFSDLCSADFADLADRIALRDDAGSPLIVNNLKSLASDGCPSRPPAVAGCEAYLDLGTSSRILRASTAAFFDQHLKGQGPGLSADAFPELVAVGP